MTVVAGVLNAARLRPIVASPTLLSGVHVVVRDPAGGLQDREEAGMARDALGTRQRNVCRMAEDDRAGRSVGPLIGHVWRQSQLRRSVASSDSRTGEAGCQYGSDDQAPRS